MRRHRYSAPRAFRDSCGFRPEAVSLAATAPRLTSVEAHHFESRGNAGNRDPLHRIHTDVCADFENGVRGAGYRGDIGGYLVLRYL
eukprot:scaffold7935_cov417-Prasinococcus_capsulatus_cf.AAC.4